MALIHENLLPSRDILKKI